MCLLYVEAGLCMHGSDASIHGNMQEVELAKPAHHVHFNTRIKSQLGYGCCFSFLLLGQFCLLFWLGCPSISYLSSFMNSQM